MPTQNTNNNSSAFIDNKDLYNKTPKVEPAPEKQIGIDTQDKFFNELIEEGINSTLDMSAFDSFLTASRSRDQLYNLIDDMSHDSILSAVLETYAEDATETNDSGDIVWAESANTDIAKYINYLLKSMRVNKHVYGWIHSLCKYGDLYLRLYRESDFEKDSLFDEEDNCNKKKLNEDLDLNSSDLVPELDGDRRLDESIKIKAYGKNDHYVHYLEAVPNPAEMFELTKFGKTYAYIKSEVNSDVTGNQDWFNGSEFMTYKFKRNDIRVYQPTEFVHGYLEDDSDRIPEEVSITFDKNGVDGEEEETTARYKVRRGQSLLYPVFKVWRMLSLIENSVLLNRVTKSAVLRLFQIEVGDMPKEQVPGHLQKVKSLMEQKMALRAGKSANEYTNPGPIENNVYVTTHGGVGNITMQTIGGDVDVGQLTDLDYFRRKLFGALRVPCLRGDTPILLLNGKTATISEMYQNKDAYIGLGIMGCKQDGTLCPTKIARIEKTSDHATFIRIHLDNSKYVDVTPNHLMMLRDGIFVKASDIKEGDSLMPYYDKIKNRRRYVLDNKTGKYLPQYRAVAESMGEIPHGMQVHHKNAIKIDDDFSNLETITIAEHWERHKDTLIALSIKQNEDRKTNHIPHPNIGKIGINNGIENRWISAGETIPDGFVRGHIHHISDDLRKKLSNAMRKTRVNNKEAFSHCPWEKGKCPERIRQKMHESAQARLKNMSDTEREALHNRLSERAHKTMDWKRLYQAKMEIIPPDRRRLPRKLRCPVCGKIFDKNLNIGEFEEYLNQLHIYCCSKECYSRISGGGKISRSYNLLRKCSMDFDAYEKTRNNGEKRRDFYYSAERLKQIVEKYLYDYEPKVNHKVVKIEQLDVVEPSYDIMVEDDCHTFALPCGIFVHNCQYFGYTDDNAGFSGGQSLSIISSRYAKMVMRIQSVISQTLTDAINLMLIDKGLTGYVNNYAIKMQKPVTQADIDRRDNLTGNLQATRDIVDLLNDSIDDTATKLEILKTLLSSYVTDTDFLDILQKEITKLSAEKEKENEDEANQANRTSPITPIERENTPGLADDLGLGQSAEETGSEESAPSETPASEEGNEEALPTPAELGLDFTDSDQEAFS